MMNTRNTKERHPQVTVLVPVYNAGVYLQESVGSILRQTYKNFELLILDDGSTDGCADFLKEIDDQRIRLIRRRHDYIATLNYGLSTARGKYIARMDADDRMYPTRLSQQVKVMEQYPEVVLCAAYMRELGGRDIYNSGLSGTLMHYAPVFLVGNFISHPTVMLRTDYVRRHKLRYKAKYIYAEDYKLWTDIACLGGVMHIIPKPLLEYRIFAEQVSRVHNQEQRDAGNRIRNELLAYLMKHAARRYKRHLCSFYNACARLNEDRLLGDAFIFNTFYRLFSRIMQEEADSLLQGSGSSAV